MITKLATVTAYILNNDIDNLRYMIIIIKIFLL